jgi:hypothetical protein
VDEDEVALLPVVTLVVVDLVAAAFEDVEGGLVLVAVPGVGGMRRQLDEVDLQGLGEERVVARPDPPPCPGLLRVPGVAHGSVVGDDRVVAHPGGRELSRPEILQTVVFRGDATEEHPSALCHADSFDAIGLTVIPLTPGFRRESR